MRHDEENILFAYQAKKFFRDVEVEPMLQELNGEIMDYKSANIKAEARSDIRIRGFWARRENAFFDFRIVYPFASSYLSKSPEALYRSVAKIKKREYEQRIVNVEAGSFPPMVMSTSGGMCVEMSMAVKHLAKKLSEKFNDPYPQVIGLLRCRLAFCMMRSALTCLRGSRTLKPRNFDLVDESILDTPAVVISEEARIPY